MRAPTVADIEDAYEQSLLEECRDVVEAGRWHCTVGEHKSRRFLCARAYGGARVKGKGFGRQLAYGLRVLAVSVGARGVGEVAGGWFGEADPLAMVA